MYICIYVSRQAYLYSLLLAADAGGPAAQVLQARDEKKNWAANKSFEISQSSNSNPRELELTNFLGLVLGCIETSKQSSRYVRSFSEKKGNPGIRAQLKCTWPDSSSTVETILQE